MATELAIIRKENIEVIVSSAPTAYNENTVSHDRCIDAGKALLARMQQGMTDELDQEAATFIEKARKTVRKMNDKRAPLTKLFDEIRSAFTSMENDIDATKKDTVPARIQDLRNRYAAQKREEELARQREALRQQQLQQARNIFRDNYDTHFRKAYHEYFCFILDGLHTLFDGVALDNYDEQLKLIENFNCQFDSDEFLNLKGSFFEPLSGITAEEAEQIIAQVQQQLLPGLKRDYENNLQIEHRRILQLMPSKRQELERAAQATAEEAERIRQQMKEREAAEAARLEAERQQREQQQRMEAEMKAQQNAIGNLFDQTAAVAKPAYSPKTSVKQRIVALNVEAFPEIITMWWTKEGCTLSIDELTKMFKKQITFCEKCAKDGEYIKSENIAYEDEVKAK